jgi:hypothetical protein
MAKVTDEYVCLACLRNFRRMTYYQQQGIIEALRTVMDTREQDEDPPPLLAQAAEQEEPGGLLALRLEPIDMSGAEEPRGAQGRLIG